MRIDWYMLLTITISIVVVILSVIVLVLVVLVVVLFWLLLEGVPLWFDIGAMCVLGTRVFRIVTV